jgi:TrmH family RNA methyltransferase
MPFFWKCLDKLQLCNSGKSSNTTQTDLMLTKADINFIKSLQDKKERQRRKLFIAEGPKVVNELLNSLCAPFKIYATSADFVINLKEPSVLQLVSDLELARISSLKSTRNCIGIFKMPEPTIDESDVVFALENLQDPGNLGTIIRIADWYGITKVVCSLNTVDCYNSKTVQSSMASIGRVNIIYTDLYSYLKSCNKVVYAANLTGNSIYNIKWQKPCIILIGNEGKGLSNELLQIAQFLIQIPRIGKAESLNAAVAAAIIADRCCGL